MPNTPVLAAGTGLPSIRPDLREIMLIAHDYACEMQERLPYADRFREALRRSWRDAKASLVRCLRAIVEDRIERLIAFLDALDGDENLEPALAGSQTSAVLDAEESCEDEGAQCDDEGHDSDLELSMGWTEVQEGAQFSGQPSARWDEENAFFPEVLRSLDSERAATAQTCTRFAEIIATLKVAKTCRDHVARTERTKTQLIETQRICRELNATCETLCSHARRLVFPS